MTGKLAVLHIDGLSHAELVQAFDAGLMPATRALIEKEGYEALPYHCGVPSTTPYAQAGILYGDNREIPGFRWWDRQAGMIVQFGTRNTFARIAHRYFRGTRPLCEGGACIAGCYPAGAEETFGLAYRDRTYSRRRDPGAGHVLAAYASDPLNLADMLAHGALAAGQTAAADVRARLTGRRPARAYVISDVLEEVLLHHLTRYATVAAMRAGYPAIYAAFYAYDETGHAFGPSYDYTREMLRHVDRSIAAAAAERERGYELVVLSDHGQVETVPILEAAGTTVGERVARRLPGCRIEEQGRAYGPERDAHTRVVLTHSGGLCHLYFAGFPERLQTPELRRRFSGLAEDLSATPGVGLVLMRDADRDVYLAAGQEVTDADQVLAGYGDPQTLRRDLHWLNGFAAAGDIMLIGAWDGRRQVNFEEQEGGHGSIGGSQTEPFVLVRRELGVDAGRIQGSADLHPVLLDLRRRQLRQ
ncbi:MAG TPA: alkaline phosphatase family protein [Candidatus Dormibacteraeota bacterium]